MATLSTKILKTGVGDGINIVGVVISMGVGDGWNCAGVTVSMGIGAKAGVVAAKRGCVAAGVGEGSVIGKPGGTHAALRIRMKRKTRDFILTPPLGGGG